MMFTHIGTCNSVHSCKHVLSELYMYNNIITYSIKCSACDSNSHYSLHHIFADIHLSIVRVTIATSKTELHVSTVVCMG